MSTALAARAQKIWHRPAHRRRLPPQDGDTFTVLETWLDLNEDGSTTEVQQEGPTLNISFDEPLRWIEMDAAAGQYTVGFIVEDLDGQEYPTYTEIEVLP